MCGIVYKSSFYTESDIPRFVKSCELLNHRGPDEWGYVLNNRHMLGHKRLSIVDLINGHQPMSNDDHHLIYNGELYNIEELKRYLINDGINLDNCGDTFLLFNLLLKYNESIINSLNGIFAFVYIDKDEVIAARDPFGVKPLYYSFYDKDIIISSEIKSILSYKEESIVDRTGICELLGMGPSHSQGKTVFKDIYELKPGHYLKFSKSKGFTIHRYYELKAYPFNYSYKETVKRVRELLDKAIKRQLISDVGVSTFLSGGLDSSIISTIVARQIPKLDTYSIDYEDNDTDYKANAYEIERDNSYALKVSNAIKSNHHMEVISTDDVVKLLTHVVDLKDFPGMTDIDSSMYYLATKIAKDHKVSLSGECADEIFGGYPWYYKKEKEACYFPWIRNIEFRESLLNPKIKDKINLSKYVENEYNEAIKEVKFLPDDTPTMKKQRELFYLNTKYFMTNLLDRKDRMTMGASLEVRVPFCDRNLVEFLYNVPFKYKYRSKTEKKLLRDAYKDIVIPDVIERKKSPYPKSKSKKYDEIVKNLVLKALDNKDSILYQIFDIEEVIKLVNSDIEFDIPWYGQLMRKTAMLAYIYQIDYWGRKYNIKLEL